MKHDTFTKTYYRDISNDHINIAGVAIGNGVLDYFYQEPSYAEYAYTHGLIPLAAKKKFDLEWMECLENVSQTFVWYPLPLFLPLFIVGERVKAIDKRFI